MTRRAEIISGVSKVFLGTIIITEKLFFKKVRMSCRATSVSVVPATDVEVVVLILSC